MVPAKEWHEVVNFHKPLKLATLSHLGENVDCKQSYFGMEIVDCSIEDWFRCSREITRAMSTREEGSKNVLDLWDDACFEQNIYSEVPV